MSNQLYPDQYVFINDSTNGVNYWGTILSFSVFLQKSGARNVLILDLRDHIVNFITGSPDESFKSLASEYINLGHLPDWMMTRKITISARDKNQWFPEKSFHIISGEYREIKKQIYGSIAWELAGKLSDWSHSFSPLNSNGPSQLCKNAIIISMGNGIQGGLSSIELGFLSLPSNIIFCMSYDKYTQNQDNDQHISKIIERYGVVSRDSKVYKIIYRGWLQLNLTKRVWNDWHFPMIKSWDDYKKTDDLLVEYSNDYAGNRDDILTIFSAISS